MGYIGVKSPTDPNGLILIFWDIQVIQALGRIATCPGEKCIIIQRLFFGGQYYQGLRGFIYELALSDVNARHGRK